MAISSQAEWEERAAAFLKHKLREAEVTYADLAKRLKKHGFKETEASITNKLKRGSFAATFFSGVHCGPGIGRSRARGNLIHRRK